MRARTAGGGASSWPNYQPWFPRLSGGDKGLPTFKIRLPAQLKLEIHERLAAHAGGPLIGADLAERFGILQVHRGSGIAPGVIVEHVLKVQPELQMEPLLDRDVLLRRSLRIQQARSGDDVAAGIARREGGRIREEALVDDRVDIRLVEAVPAEVSPAIAQRRPARHVRAARAGER